MIIYPFPSYMDYAYTPRVPDLYFNVKSQEQRIAQLCCEIDKLIHYIGDLKDTVNSQYEIIQQLETLIPELVNEDVSDYLDEGLADPESTVYEIINDVVEDWADERTSQVDANTEAIAKLKDGNTYNDIANNGFIYRED